ncbi:ATP-dependent DNA helicase DinG [Paenibacillus yanchengensis]|uniref:3'-5' exonuclease DinG n=1 Tax=Paenibacillus yanchengensis TaxID=2035833 RepID=A0ABW4YKG3_9BACL
MKYAVIDLETTGHSAEDSIIQVAAVIIDDKLNIIDTFNSYVRPTVAIPPFITNLTGIDDETVKSAPVLEEVLISLIGKLDDTVLVAHNVGFDAGFLNQSLEQNGYMPFVGRKLDTVEMLRILYPSISSYQLGAVAAYFSIPHEEQHKADHDAMATAQIFITMTKKLRQMPLLTLQRLTSFIDESSDLGWFMQQAEQHVTTYGLYEPDDLDYYRQFALRSKEWYSDKEKDDSPASEVEELSFEQYFQQVQTNFAEKFPLYEERPAQSEMIQHVYDALLQDDHLMIEAGTGTGKSMGYLLPAIYYSKKFDKPVIVSTHTINLQEQLRQRDLPLLAEILPFSFQAAIFKGRRNYLCLRKFEARANGSVPMETVDDKHVTAQMTVWLAETETGDHEELNLSGRGLDVWETVASDADSCLNRACPWFRRCYYHKARNEASQADVTVTNHSLLFTDVAAEHRLLPAYRHLIIDEAHHLEEVASKHLGFQNNYLSAPQLITRLFKDAKNGLLLQLRHCAMEETDEQSNVWIETIDDLIPQLTTMKERWDVLFDLLYQLVDHQSEEQVENGGLVLRLHKDKLPEQWNVIVEHEQNLHSTMNQFVTNLDKLLLQIKERAEESVTEAVVVDINGIVRDLTRIKDELKMFVKLENKDYVFWLEASAVYRHRSIYLYAAPIDVSSQLQKYFFDVKDSIIMTSATLTVQKSFQYAAEQLGLTSFEQAGRLKTVVLPSPFNYREQALVVIPRDFPVLKGANVSEEYLLKLARSLADAAKETGGRMLVLFTSYRMLKQTYEPLKQFLADSDISILGQGVDSSNRTKLVRRFMQQPKTVLLGTSSFWEGVDIPGDALLCLAIVRLPFQPPNHPLIAAKAELLEQKKQNPFMKLSIPQAVIRFKQGFGRLVRSSQDKGIVILYDTRVIESYYGKHFLYSLPGPKIETMYAEQMILRMREWLST